MIAGASFCLDCSWSKMSEIKELFVYSNTSQLYTYQVGITHYRFAIDIATQVY